MLTQKIASISLNEVYMGRDKEFPPTPRMQYNAAALCARVNRLLERLRVPSPVYVSSGYRPGHYNRDAGGAPHSGHLDCRAVDLWDKDGTLAMAILANGGEAVLAAMGLWMESPSATSTWVHLDIVERPGPRIFGVAQKHVALQQPANLSDDERALEAMAPLDNEDNGDDPGEVA